MRSSVVSLQKKNYSKFLFRQETNVGLIGLVSAKRFVPKKTFAKQKNVSIKKKSGQRNFGGNLDKNNFLKNISKGNRKFWKERSRQKLTSRAQQKEWLDPELGGKNTLKFLL